MSLAPGAVIARHSRKLSRQKATGGRPSAIAALIQARQGVGLFIVREGKLKRFRDGVCRRTRVDLGG